MLPKLTTLIFLFSSFFICSQTNYSNYSTLKSIGGMPTELRENYFFGQFNNSQTPFLRIGKTREYEIHAIFDGLIRAGLVVYGDETQEICQAITDEIVSSDDSIGIKISCYLLKSNFIGLLNNRRNQVLVPSGTLAKLNTIEQLYFLIAREVYFLKSQTKSVVTRYNRYKDLPNQLRLLTTFNPDEVLKADAYAYRRLVALNLNTTKGIYALDKLDAANLIFEEMAIPSSEIVQGYTIPDSYSDLTKHRFGKMTITPAMQNLIARRKQLQTNEPVTEFSESNLAFAFDHIRNLCMLQGIEEFLIDNDPLRALYTVHMLEKKLGNTPYLIRTKALCWVTLSQQYSSLSLLQLGKKFYIQETPSAAFLITLYRMNNEEITLIALQNLLDYQENYPAYKTEFKQLFLAVLSNLERTNSSVISQYFIDTKGGNTPTFKSITPLGQQLFTSLNQNPVFKLLIISENNRSAFKTTLFYPEITVFKRQTYFLQKSQQRRGYLHESLTKNKINYVAVDSIKDSIALTDMYNTKNLFLRIQYQMYRQTNHKYTVVPVNYFALNELAQQAGSNQVGTMNIENQFNLNPQGYHLLGFFLIPAPFVITDYFIGGNHTRLFAYVYDKQSQEMLIFDNYRYRDPLLKAFIENKTYQTFKPLYYAK